MKADLEKYLLIELPSVSTRILEKTLVKTMCSHMEDKKVIWNSMDSQTTNCGWTVWVLALRRWLAWWMKEEVIYLSFCKSCYMVFLQPNWWDMDLSSGLQGECTIGHMRLQELWSAVKSPIDEWFLVTFLGIYTSVDIHSCLHCNHSQWDEIKQVHGLYLIRGAINVPINVQGYYSEHSQQAGV